MSLEGRVAVITGAGGTKSGFGHAYAQALADAGASVVLADVDKASIVAHQEALTTEGKQAMWYMCDVTNANTVDAMFAHVKARWGRVDILVNNAGVTPSTEADMSRKTKYYENLNVPHESLGFTSTMPSTEWQRYWATNVHGTFYCTRAALKLMEAQKYGRIINIASVAGFSAASAYNSAYAASKGAVIAFTKSVAYEVAGSNILVNALAPSGGCKR